MLDIIFSDDSGQRALRKCDSSDAGMALLGMTATLAGAQTHPAAFTSTM
jgi:hypothetical protein